MSEPNTLEIRPTAVPLIEKFGGPCECIGRFRGDELWWDFADESISDVDLRRWVWNHFPEDSQWRRTDGGIVAYHTRAYANRRVAIDMFMGAQKW